MNVSTDDEFLAAFENCTLPFERWTHRAHVRVAYLYASRHDIEFAIDRMRSSIKTYNQATGTPETIDRGYHETITQAFMRLVFAANLRTGPHESSDEFCEANSELLSKFVLQSFYSSERLMTVKAKAEFVEPDLCQLPLETGKACGDEQQDDLDADSYTLVEELSEKQIEQLHALIQKQWWGGKRSLEDVKLMVENTSMMLGLVDKETDWLIGYCRVLTDFAFRATIYDVMVADDLRGFGLGKRLMDALCNHPKLQRVSFIYLACEPKLSPFYERCGFKTYEGKAEWMIKVQREE